MSFFFLLLRLEKENSLSLSLTVAADDQPRVLRAQLRHRHVWLGRDAEAALVRGADSGLEALELP